MAHIAEPQLALDGSAVTTVAPSNWIGLPAEDNTPEGLQSLLAANAHYRSVAWPAPYDQTTHSLRLGDARDLSWLPDESVHLIVTSPPIGR